MSILVALTCEECGVIATDSRAIWPGNRVDDTHPKTFSFEDGSRKVIGGVSGLLVVRDRAVADYVGELWSQATTLDSLVAACTVGLQTKLSGSAVGVDLVLLASADLGRSGSPLIRWMTFQSNGGAIDVSVEAREPKFVTGDASARDAINGRLDAHGWGPGEDKLRADAREAIVLGVERSGHYSPEIKSCGGSPSVVGLTLGKGA